MDYLKKQILLLALFIFSGLSCFSQTNFQTGYYITWEDDTVHGLINNMAGVGNSLVCAFKPDDSSNQLKFAPEDIKAYRFASGQFYTSKMINIKGVKSQVFVEFLVDGISNLYFYRDHENYFYLIESENGEILELYKEELTFMEGKGQISHDTYRHIRMLKLAFADCMEIQPQIEHASLTHKSLIKLTKNYHNFVCEDQECIVYEKKIGPPKIYIAPVLGYAISSLKFDEGFYSRFAYDQGSNLVVGAQINAILTKLNEKVSLQADLLFEKNEYYGTYNDYYELFIKNSLFQLAVLGKYTFPKWRVRPTIALGLVGNFILDTQAHAIVDNVPGNPPKEHEIEDIYMGQKQIGAVAQIGLNYRIFKRKEAFTNFRYVASQGVAKGSQGPVTTTLNSISFTIGMYLRNVH